MENNINKETIRLFQMIIENYKTQIILGAIILGLYVIYILYRVLKPKKSTYEQEIEKVLTSDKNKVKGRFE